MINNALEKKLSLTSVLKQYMFSSNFLYKKVVFCFALFFAATFFAISQENRNNDIISGYIKSLTLLWETNNTKLFDTYIVDSTLSLKSDPFILSKNTNKQNQKELQLRYNATQQQINKKDVGLKFTLNYQENFNSPVADPENIIVFKRRAVTGLEWDILKNGFYENKTKNKILKLEYEALEKKQAIASVNAIQTKQTEQILRHFNKKKIEILDSRKKLNNEQTITVEKLWSIKHITKDDYLKAIQNTTDINAQYNLYKNYNDAQIKDKSNFEFDLPILEIELDSLFKSANLEIIDTTSDSGAEIAKIKSSYISTII